jgi:hypothetical protein
MSRFDGDGRETVGPRGAQHVLDGTSPLRVRRATARMIIGAFEKAGLSYHSGSGGTLWIILEHCATNSIGVSVEGKVGLGFVVRKRGGAK